MSTMLIALLLFSVFHSLTATISFKAVMVAVMGQRAYLGLYRLLYNFVSLVTFFPVLASIAASPGKNIWQFEGGLALLLLGIQVMGGLGLLISILQIDALRFAGITQAIAYFTGGKLPLPEEKLTFNGVYRLVRHPLYLFSLMYLWAQPTMSTAWFGLCVGATLYFAVGSLLEEKKLRSQFGEVYTAYQRQVPWMIPFLKW